MYMSITFVDLGSEMANLVSGGHYCTDAYIGVGSPERENWTVLYETNHVDIDIGCIEELGRLKPGSACPLQC